MARKLLNALPAQKSPFCPLQRNAGVFHLRRTIRLEPVLLRQSRTGQKSTRWEGRLGLVMGNGLRLGDSPVQMSRVADSRKGPPL